MDRPIESEEEHLLEGIVGDGSVDVSADVQSSQIRSILWDLLGQLPDEEEDLLRLRFGFITDERREDLDTLYGYKGPQYTLKEIGNIYGVTNEAVRLRERKAIKRLRSVVAATPELSNDLVEHLRDKYGFKKH